MNIKRIILATAILMIAVGTAGVISAQTYDDVIDTQHDIKFNMPDGYEVEKEDPGISDYSINCTNDNGDSFTIDLKRSYTGELSVFGDFKEIEGHEGVIREYTNGMIGFFYMDGDYMVEIKAPDESVIESLFDTDDEK